PVGDAASPAPAAPAAMPMTAPLAAAPSAATSSTEAIAVGLGKHATAAAPVAPASKAAAYTSGSRPEATIPPLSGDPVADIRAALAAVSPNRASDLHISADSAPKLRIDGQLQDAPGAEMWDEHYVREA